MVYVLVQGEMGASPEIFAHLTQLLMPLASGRMCAVLEVSQFQISNFGSFYFQSCICSFHICVLFNTILVFFPHFLGWVQPDFSGPISLPDCPNSSWRSGPRTVRTQWPLWEVSRAVTHMVNAYYWMSWFDWHIVLKPGMTQPEDTNPEVSVSLVLFLLFLSCWVPPPTITYHWSKIHPPTVY